MDPSQLECILPGLCQNFNIETLNFACNGLNDSASHLLSRIVSAQSERRDQVVWAYALRGELPPDDDYKMGLKEIILSHNSLGDITASELVLALRNDIFMRSVDLRSNDIGEEWARELVLMLRDNKTLTNMDLRENPGFSEREHRELALMLLRNI